MTLNRCLVTAFVTGLAFPTFAADLLANGSFEAPSVTPNTYQQVTPQDWSWQGSEGLLFNGLVLDAVSGINWPTAQDGQQFVDIGNVSTYSITGTFVVLTAGAYRLSWYENAHVNADSSPYSASVQDSSLATVLEVNLNAANVGVWEHQTYSLGLGPGSYSLTFTARGVPQGYDTLLDNVSVAAVPEPSALVLLALGIPLLLTRALRPRR